MTERNAKKFKKSFALSALKNIDGELDDGLVGLGCYTAHGMKLTFLQDVFVGEKCALSSVETPRVPRPYTLISGQ